MRKKKSDQDLNEFIESADKAPADVKSQPKAKGKNITLRLNADEAKMLEMLAEKSERSQQKMIIHLIKEAASKRH